jgi:hypothetical protein
MGDRLLLLCPYSALLFYYAEFFFDHASSQSHAICEVLRDCGEYFAAWSEI